MSKRRLGKGIDALLQGRDLEQLENLNTVVTVPLDRVRPNPDQPRKSFSEESLGELAASIRERGIIQPILAEEQQDGSYVIIAGERRYRAAGLAGLDFVPVLPVAVTEEERLEIALIENIQREDLNPIEEAQAYRSLMDAAGYTQEDLAGKLGKSRAAVANTLRLLRLPEELRRDVSDGRLSAGHARALLGLDSPQAMSELGRLVVEGGYSVRETEKMAGRVAAGLSPVEAAVEPVEAGPTGPTGREPGATEGRGVGKAKTGTVTKPIELKNLEDRLIEHLGTRVLINGSEHRGRIEITYLSMDDLERVFSLISGSPV